MVGGEVVAKQFVINGCAHQDDPEFGELTHDSFNREQDKVSIDVPFVNLVEDDKGVLVEELGAVHHSLQEDPIRDKYDLILGVNMRLHSDLVADLVALHHLLRQNRLQVDHCQSPRLHAHYLSLLPRAPQVLVNQSRHLGRFSTPCLSSHQHHLILGDRLDDRLLLFEDGQFVDVPRYPVSDLDRGAFGVDEPLELEWVVDNLWLVVILLLFGVRA